METPRQRKPRFQRIANSAPVQLTERDFLILRLLSEHRFLQSHQLTNLVPGSSQHLIRRLGRLYHAGLIERPRHQLLVSGLPRATFVYCLTERGRKELISLGSPVFGSVPRIRSSASAYSLSHEVLLSEATVSLRKKAVSNGIDFLWHQQLLSSSSTEDKGKIRQLRWSVTLATEGRSTRSFVIPDAAFALRSAKDNPAWFFLELDRGTMPVSRSDPAQTCFLRKIHAYKETRRSGVLWKRHEISGFRVLVVATGRKRLKSLQTATAATFVRGESRMFLFACLDDLTQADNPLGPIWQTCSGKEDSLIEPLSTGDWPGPVPR